MDLFFYERLKNGESFYCECCGRFTKMYKRQIHHSIARSLIALYHLNKSQPEKFFHTSVFCRTDTGSDFAITKHWKLIEDADVQVDGKRTSGLWRITEKGKQFAENKFLIPKYALVYDDTFLGHDGNETSIKTCLKNKYNYEELMSL